MLVKHQVSDNINKQIKNDKEIALGHSSRKVKESLSTQMQALPNITKPGFLAWTMAVFNQG